MAPVSTIAAGIDGFIAGLEAQGIEAARRGEVLIYRVTALSGHHSGEEIETGIVAAELAGWPNVPPHWVHLPDSIELPGGSREVSGHIAGWSRYSRPCPGRFDASPAPARDWVAHVRRLLSSATR